MRFLKNDNNFFLLYLFLIVVLSSAVVGSEKCNKRLLKKIKQPFVLESTLKSLLEKEADPNAFCDKQELSIFHTALIRATRKEAFIKRVELLLEYKANPNLKDKRGCIPFDYLLGVFNKKKEQLIALLFKHNADPNIKGCLEMVPLMTVFGFRFKGWYQLVKIFLENKADLNIRYNKDQTPLHYFFDQAILFDRKMIQIFIDYGADKTFFEKRFGNIVLDDQTFTLLKIGLTGGINFNELGMVDFDKRILHTIIYNNNISLDMINLFLKYGLNPCVQHYNGNFSYEEAHIFQKPEKRNMLAYAIPHYIYQKNKKALNSLKTFLLCLRSVNKEWKLIIPKPIVHMVRDHIFDFKLVDRIFKTIKHIESDNIWSKNDVEDLKKTMQSLIERFG